LLEKGIVAKCFLESKAFLMKFILETYGILEVEKVFLTGGASLNKAI
jgi:hypothetical protein